MDRLEFSISFDTYFNNITSNQAPGLNEHEKSLFLTKAQDEVLKNYFNPKSNKLQEGFDDNQKRQIDFSSITKVAKLKVIKYAGEGPCRVYANSSLLTDDADYLIFHIPSGLQVNEMQVVAYDSDSVDYDNTNNLLSITFDSDAYDAFGADEFNTLFESSSNNLIQNCWVEGNGYIDYQAILEDAAIVSSNSKRMLDIQQIDPRSTLFEFPKDVLFVVNERVYSDINRLLRVIPINFEEYDRLMSKPYKYPTKYCAWRLLSTDATKYVELVAPGELSDYRIRYVRKPKPIILADLGLSINGYYFEGGTVPEGGNYLPTNGECELDPILHEEILQRAVELAKIAWTQTGQDNTQAVLQAGQRSE